MRSHVVVLSALSACAVAVAGLGPVFAQKGDPVQTQASQEQVTVVGPRVMRTQVRGPRADTHGMGYYDLMTMTREVSYADLNLARPEDAKTLERRIDQAANDICRQLSDAPPAEPDSAEYCTHRAITSAMEEAHAAVAAARK